MPGRFLKFSCSQVVALALWTPAAAQSEVPAGLFRKGPSFQQRVEQRLEDHEERLNRLEVVSPVRRSSSSGSGKNPVRSTVRQPVAAQKPSSSSSAARSAGASTAKSGSKTSKKPSTSKPPSAKPSNSGVHTVRAGETVYSIARRYGVSVARLLQANGLTENSIIRPGNKLTLPGGKLAAAPDAVATAPGTASNEAPPGKVPNANGAPGKAGASAGPAPGFGRYTVKRGETVRGLAARFGVSEKEFMKLNGLADATKLRAGAVVKYPVKAAVGAEETAEAFASEEAPAPEPLPSGWRWHTVERGESLSQIAARYGQDRVSLERANDLQPGSAIYEGLRLKVPPPEVTLDTTDTETERPPAGEDNSVLGYTVQNGDTLEKLADTFATTPTVLRKLNRLAPEDSLASGRRIVVPNNLFE